MWEKLKNRGWEKWATDITIGLICAGVVELAKLLQWSLMTGVSLAAGIAISAVFVKLISSYRALATQVDQFKVRTKTLEDQAAESDSEIVRLRARLDANRASIPRRFVELVNDIAKDGLGHRYP